MFPKKITITFDDEAHKALQKIKDILSSEDVLLLYDYEKPFDLTTDTSSHALGAVLSQGGRPITMISRTLSQTEENYATNERELLAIVWSLQKLRNYLYGANNINIFTDHQPLTFSISDKNPNAKLKRWRAFVEEFSPKFHYKPGKENVVADALSRQHINALNPETASDSDDETVHSEESSTEVVPTALNPINTFRNQIILERGEINSKTKKILFRSRIRHNIIFQDIDSIFEQIKDCLNPNVTNGLLCELPILGKIQRRITTEFPGIKFVHTKTLVTDILNEDDQKEILYTEHNRAHRSLKENMVQVLRDYYFPNMRKMLKEIVRNCKICQEAKYQRHPPNPGIGRTPIPSKPGEILHVDIFSTDRKYYLTCIDKFSKFALVQSIPSRSIVDIKEPLIRIMNFFKDTKSLVCDNEKSLNSNTIKALLKDHFNVSIFTTPPHHSTTNGQIERFHGTLSEISRCIKLSQGLNDTNDLLLLAAYKYNRTIHSVTGQRPVDIIHSSTPEYLGVIKHSLIKAQNSDINYHNKNRTTKIFQPGEKVFIKNNRRIGNKLTKLYTEKTVERDLGTTVLIDGKKIHKSNLKN